MMTHTRQLVDREQWIVSRARGASVLHIGCLGADRKAVLHRQIKGVARSCVGIDLAPPENEGYIAADAQNFELQSAFDLIFAGEIIEHLWDHRGFFTSCFRHLNPGGSLVISTPNAYSALALLNAVVRKTVPNDSAHVVLFDATTLGNLVRNYCAASRVTLSFYEERAVRQTLAYGFQRTLGRIVPKLARGLLVEIVK